MTLHWIDGILPIILWWWPYSYIEFKEYEEKIKFELVKVMNFMSQTESSHLLLSSTFIDDFWRSHCGIPHSGTWHNNRGHHEKKIQFKQHFATTSWCLTKNLQFLRIPEHFWVHFTMLASSKVYPYVMKLSKTLGGPQGTFFSSSQFIWPYTDQYPSIM